MPAPDRNPLANTSRLLIDGTNLLHSLQRSAGAAPAATLIGRLRGVVPASVAIELVFDGPAERGLRGERIASGTTVRYGGPRSADDLILALIDEARVAEGPAATAALLVVTDDRDLRYGARIRGARTAGSAWLLGRLSSGRLSSSSIGNPRPPRPPGPGAGSGSRSGRGGPAQSSAASADSPPPQSDGDPAETDRVGWRPGRGATTKRGNPRRAPRTGGAGRMRP